MDFQYFSKVYDLFMDMTLYEKWLDYVKDSLEPPSSILELGCGSGHLGILMKKEGFNNTGLDLSGDMLSIAKENQNKSRVSFPLIQRDMKDLSEIGSYDSVVSFSDSLCYLEDVLALKKVFQEVYGVLNENGTFLFDVHSILQMEEFKKFSYHDEREDAVFLWDSFEGKKDYSVEHDLTFFVRVKDNQYLRMDETHKERTYTLSTYKQLLEETGFINIEVSGDFTGELSEESRRWFFKAKKR